jgi:Pyruvate/2-oxoacid:ferredoxin oxidoreductase delta subunit
MTHPNYKKLAIHLDNLPEGYPATEDGAELRILEHLFTPEEAGLASQLRITLENPREIASRIGGDPKALKTQLKSMARKGLIRLGKAETRGLGYGTLPFAVGIYELQTGNMDATFARLFEDYYLQAFVETTKIQPKFHRVIPVGETIRNDMSIEPFESASEIIENAKAWGVTDCLCRQQKAFIGDPCDHPQDVCMTFNQRPGAFDGSPKVRALTKEEAYATLQRAADAGLVHSVSNNQDADSFINHYICNCCTCSCGILRGIAVTGISNVITRSTFVNVVDPELCTGCDICIEYCQFDALSLSREDSVIQINRTRCVGCGVCVPKCPDDALSMIRRPEDEILPIPQTHDDWLVERAAARGLDLTEVL